MPTYYYGSEDLAEWGIETSPGTPVTPTDGFSYLRSAEITDNENVERGDSIGGGTFRKMSQDWKGPHDASFNLTFWLPDDLDATTLDVWFLKMALDAFNVAYSSDRWSIPNTGASIYGSNSMASFTLEIGHNKSGAVRNHILTGCMVETLTIRATSAAKVEFVVSGKAILASHNVTSFTNGTATRSSAVPFGWQNCTIGYANDGASPASKTDFTSFEATFNNSLFTNRDLSVNSATRKPTGFIPQKQTISGTATINMTTTSGMDLFDALTGDGSAPYDPAASGTKKAFQLSILTNTAASQSTQKLVLTLRNVIIGQISMSFDPEKHQEVTFPWTAQYFLFDIVSPDTTAPSNWDDQN